jgi:hypothetical protein
MEESARLIYLEFNNILHQVPRPGWNASSTYRSFDFWSVASEIVNIDVSRTAGSEEAYNDTRVIRIAASNVVDHRTSSAS